MNTEEALEIVETELSKAREAYGSKVVAQRLRNEKNSGYEEEIFEGMNLAVELFKMTLSQGKEDCLERLNNRRSSIRPGRSSFLEGFDFVYRIVEQWEP